MLESRPRPNLQEDIQVFAALQQGQLSALKPIYTRYGGLVYGLALAILTDRQEAEDLTQDIFLNLCRSCTYNPERGAPSTYLITLTRSRALDRLRSRHRRRHLFQRWGQVVRAEPTPVPPLENINEEAMAQYVSKALADLPKNQRQVLELSYFQGLSQSEIATALGTPLGTVKTWVRKGLASLHQTLKDLIE